MKTILNIPHLEQKTGYNCISALHPDIILALFFLSYLTIRHNLLFAYTWALFPILKTKSKQTKNSHSSSGFPVVKYLAMNPINLLLYYTSFPKGITNITLIMNFNATQASPSCALPDTFHNYFYAAFWGHILQLVLHDIPCHV